MSSGFLAIGDMTEHERKLAELGFLDSAKRLGRERRS